MYVAGLSPFDSTAPNKLDDVRPLGAMINKEPMLQQYSGVYDPEELSALGKILDEAFAALPASMQTPENRTELAKLVLAREATSESDLATLRNLMDAVASAA
ncbi:hypothetical protein [Bradyrhizobium sp. 170]|uniref:hypothetical protein n=1 Tax=Bradyrhizobium sp. 170 TaxID=2782641 RepID=UPI001FFF978F|nr:hypothetical protein [Bradyrhizobium sp. 170]